MPAARWTAVCRRVAATAGLTLAVAPALCAAATPPAGTVDLALVTSPDTAFTPFADASSSGVAVAALGDVNGDGRPDVAVSSPNATAGAHTRAGIVHVIFGGDAMAGELADLSGGGFEIRGAVTNNHVGRVVAPAGDVNGDGVADIAVANPRISRDGQRAGDVYVVFGKRADTSPV